MLGPDGLFSFFVFAGQALVLLPDPQEAVCVPQDWFVALVREFYYLLSVVTREASLLIRHYQDFAEQEPMVQLINQGDQTPKSGVSAVQKLRRRLRASLLF